ncbi:hypothetical protein CP532_4923 [Ophiocordyceps camponoti-leonardi (nom. inval.)]|nr:hypothetical protein CP532_4923 [Ophiocordyceps camponoti-leonardi (nom. inval.)]
MPQERLNVIALVSGGKDSFFSLLHCRKHGHSIVALANLYPAGDGEKTEEKEDEVEVEMIDPSRSPNSTPMTGHDDDLALDPDSFMYQTVGHQVLPLYAAATGIPLYRMAIRGRAQCRDRDYEASGSEGDETESMVPLLRAVKERHPEADALCSGAILSTYQRTRVESVALRLGLTPLSYLWKYPVLPTPAAAPADDNDDGSQLLRDMEAAGLEGRIVKVASGGLDGSHLWERATSEAGAARIRRAMRRFGSIVRGDGAVLGEGGEFETLVVDGPAWLFKKRLVVPEEGRIAVAEAGGSSSLVLRGARLEEKKAAVASLEGEEEDENGSVREPDLLDDEFRRLLRRVEAGAGPDTAPVVIPEPHRPPSLPLGTWSVLDPDGGLRTCCFSADDRDTSGSVTEQTARVVKKMRSALSEAGLEPADVISTVVILRDMTAFAAFNEEYGKLFSRPLPPSRVTISCGDCLTDRCLMMVSMTLPSTAGTAGRRHRTGLHVQSRSYWAPANIGPYSQAIQVPIIPFGSGRGGVKAIFIAGQIPLVPATMTMMMGSERTFLREAVLSLQHLWRIGREMKVQCWTSAVAYLAPSSTTEDKAKVAAEIWRLAHATTEEEQEQDEDEEEDEQGPDPWSSVKFNLDQRQQQQSVSLPDWKALKSGRGLPPPLFTVEVEALPRQSDIEWHAHMGLAGVDEGSVEMVCDAEDLIGGGRAWHVIVRSGGREEEEDDDDADGEDKNETLFVHTIVVAADGWEAVRRKGLYQKAMRRLGCGGDEWRTEGRPYLVYDVGGGRRAAAEDGKKEEEEQEEQQEEAEEDEDEDGGSGTLLVPCRSIWSSRGQRVGSVACYRGTIREGG